MQHLAITRRTARWLGAGLASLALVAAAAGYYVLLWHTPRIDPKPLENYYRALRIRPAPQPDVADVREAIAAAAGYIRRANLQSGQFVYLVNMDPGVPVPPDYDMVRHAGAIYALGIANSVLPDAENQVVMKRAVEFMRRCCFTAFPQDDMIGVPEAIVHSAGPRTYPLGGAGLGLAALASLARAQPGSVPVQEMRRLARFGQHLQTANGEFYARYVPSEGGRVLLGQTLYYPGEMALGWLMLHEQAPSADLVDASVSALTFLARKRARAAAPMDHWALLATARLFRTAEREGIRIPRDLLISHAIQICHTILEEGQAPVMTPAMEGALVSLGRGELTPTATRLEGLIAALTFLPPSHPITPHIASSVHRGIGFVLRAQVRNGPYRGAVPKNITRLPDDGTSATAKFNAEATEIRIDYVQHAASALAQYVAWSGRAGVLDNRSR
jgi:hypothetical protein